MNTKELIFISISSFCDHPYVLYQTVVVTAIAHSQEVLFRFPMWDSV